MATEDKPALNSWYETEEGIVFQVTAIDEGNNTIETQTLDGSIGELGMDAWEDLAVKEVQPPEDWEGSLDEKPSDWKELQK